ncbi:FRIGIDA-like protein 3 [Papaver somniferum]|uniref:FRIGIDA-like protein 3 n=1 Tax=Papaver somniferum TaxID=3469 RepID=UPI000E6F9DA9|nr:FRIGIDA-like protein 3 [Papaver somniferum]
MASMQSISTALESANKKKENLRKAFEDLQSHSSFLSSFVLQWKDLEEHFQSIQKSIDERFNELKSKEKVSSMNGSQSQSLDKQLVVVKEEKELDNNSETIVPRPEFKSLCSNMNGIGLRTYIMNNRKDVSAIHEVGVALKLAPDPAKLVLDSMVGFFVPNSKGDKDGEEAATRRTCILLLEKLYDISPQIKPQIKEKAMQVAIEWKGKLSKGEDNPLERLGFLQLLVTYHLVSSFDAKELIDLVVSIAKRKQAIDLCRSLGFTDRIPDLIRKLIEKGRHLEGVKFAYAFELVGMFPPVPLLKSYKKHAKKLADDVRQKGNQSLQAQNEATAKQISALKAIVKCIEEHKLEAEYPREGLDVHISQLEKQLSSKKRATNVPAAVGKQQQKQQAQPPQQHSGNKRSGTTAGSSQQQHTGNKRSRGPPSSQALPSSAKSVGVPPSQADYYEPPPSQAEYYHPSSMLLHGQDRVSPYLGGALSSAHHYSVGPSSAHHYRDLSGSQYSSSSGAPGPYGAGSSSLNYGLNLSPSRSQLYSFEHHLSNALYERSVAAAHGGAGGAHVLPPTHHHSAAGFNVKGLPPTSHPSYYP